MTARNVHNTSIATMENTTVDEPFGTMKGAFGNSAPPPCVPVSSCASDESSSSGAAAAAAADASPSIAIDVSGIERKYYIDPRIIGAGHQGSVRRCVDRNSGREYAVKTIRRKASGVRPCSLAREIALLRRVRHDGIVGFVDVYGDADCVHLVTELCTGGELFDRIKQKLLEDNGVPCFAENEAAEILHQVLASLSYLHGRDIAHRDIKPENILFETKEEGSPIKLVDFGMACRHLKSMRELHMTKVVGTPYYIAPEVLRKKYDKQCDLWSVGVVAYILLCGYQPFYGSTNNETLKSVLRGKYDFPSPEWDGVSAEAKDFLRGLLEMDPRRRMTADEALKHPWMARHSCIGPANLVNESMTVEMTARVAAEAA